jgi:hypothetical protein
MMEVLLRSLHKNLTDDNSRLSAIAADESFVDDPAESELSVRERLEQVQTKKRLTREVVVPFGDFVTGKPLDREVQTKLEEALKDKRSEVSTKVESLLREARCWALNCVIACLRKHNKRIDAFVYVFPSRIGESLCSVSFLKVPF